MDYVVKLLHVHHLEDVNHHVVIMKHETADGIETKISNITTQTLNDITDH